ncbi:MAG TPA: DUF5916 domain-containing protein [bacterium]|nr:DUF5916 domain-containing protein [bacterium]
MTAPRWAVPLAGALILMATVAAAQNGAPKERKTLTATRVASGDVRIDGRLDEAFWRQIPMADDFVQKEPNEGSTPSDRTEVGFVYDDDALYVGARMHCAHPESLRIELNRRDNPGNSEQLIVSIDSYRDRRTCYDFGVSVAGVRTDRYHSYDHEYDKDFSFNPVWDARTAIDSLGWTCEMRIPFSQLRFIDQEVQVWGVNMNRWIPARNEDIFWVPVPKSETGWSSWFGDLRGIRGIQPSRRLELLPYSAADLHLESESDPDNPFGDGSDFNGRVGADLKMGLGPNLTLDATINPDFGQVEADPAVVNLSAYETVFSEKRPFFIEGSQLFSVEGEDYFYSRRIGARPRGPAEGDYVDFPGSATILGAAKVTGRTAGGLSIGALSALTAREHARTYDKSTDQEAEIEVEPATGYGVLRLQQEFGASQSTAGIILTGVERDLDAADPLASLLRRRAVTGSADWNLRFKGGAYDIVGFAGFSRVEGSEGAILRTQQSSARYFQRPDAGYVRIDSGATALSGYAFGLRGGKRSGRHWLWGGGFSVESPEFELNDAGIVSKVDDIDAWSHLIYREQRPGPLFRSYEITLSQNSFWNFAAVKKPAHDPSHMLSFAELDIEATFRNFWRTQYFVGYDWPGKSDDLTRGGPLAGTPQGIFTEISASNNFTSRTTLSAFVFYFSNDIGSWEQSAGFEVGGRIGSRVSYSIEPRYSREVNARQYVATLRPDADDAGNPATYGNRYVFGNIYRSQISAQLRLNCYFTPDLSLECYAEPFAASGEYRGFGELPAPARTDLREYGVAGRTLTEVEDGRYVVTDGANTFDFRADDFGVRSFRSNAVLRWEFRPGSTLYLVWQQDRFGFEEPGRRVRLKSLEQALSAEGSHYFAVKISYWMPVS